MTRIKLCGMTCQNDIETVNQLKPDYVGFVFYPKSKRYITFDMGRELKQSLSEEITVVGVFVDEALEQVAKLLSEGTIDMAQLHGKEDEEYIKQLKTCSRKPVIKAFQVEREVPLQQIADCSADYILLDSGAGSGETFDWNLIEHCKKPLFLAGGLHTSNVTAAIDKIHPFAVDVSSGIETNGKKDRKKMHDFVCTVKKADRRER